MQSVSKFSAIALVAVIFAIPLILHGFAQREVTVEMHTNRFGTFNIKNFGAIGNGTTLNTNAINSTIEACAEAGGGTVLIPTGIFISGPITLLSNVHIYLDAGGAIKGSPELANYEVNGEIEPLINARNADNISITGKGIIDGNGTKFMDADKLHISLDFKRESTRQGSEYLRPDSEIADGPVSPLERPERLLRFSSCRNVVIRDFLFSDSPAWTLHMEDCDNVLIEGISIKNNLLVPNSDGIHCTSSRNVRIANCNIEAGDDAICVTGFGDKPGVSENVTVSNCTILSRSSGIRVGYGDNDIRNCTFQNIVIHNSNRGLGVFLRDKGSIENIRFSDIIINTRLHTGHWWGNGEPIHVSVIPREDNTTLGSLSGICFSNITANGESGVLLYGNENSRIKNISLSRVQIFLKGGNLQKSYGGNFDLRPAANAEYAIFKHDIPAVFAKYAENLTIEDVQVAWEDNPPGYFASGIFCSDFRDLTIDGLRCRQAQSTGAAITLENGDRVSIRDSRAEPGTDVFLMHSQVSHPRFFESNDLSSARIAVQPEEPGFLPSGNIMPGE